MARFDIPLPPGVAFAWITDQTTPSLDPREQSILSDRTVARRKVEFALGRAAAHRVLEELGVASEPILKGTLGEPLWPAGVVGSITHGYGLALAAAAPDSVASGIGIDLESAGRYFPGLVDQIAVDEEGEWLSTLPEAEMAKAAIELFAIKESFYKAFSARVGGYFGFDAAQAERRDGHYDVWFVKELAESLPAGRPIPAGVRWFGDLALAWLVVPPGW